MFTAQRMDWAVTRCLLDSSARDMATGVLELLHHNISLLLILIPINGCPALSSSPSPHCSAHPASSRFLRLNSHPPLADVFNRFCLRRSTLTTVEAFRTPSVLIRLLLPGHPGRFAPERAESRRPDRRTLRFRPCLQTYVTLPSLNFPGHPGQRPPSAHGRNHRPGARPRRRRSG